MKNKPRKDLFLHHESFSFQLIASLKDSLNESVTTEYGFSDASTKSVDAMQLNVGLLL